MLRPTFLLLLGLLGCHALVISDAAEASAAAAGRLHRRSLLSSKEQLEQQHDIESVPSWGTHIEVEGSSDSAAASIQIAARQALFDYATLQGLGILHKKVASLAIPEVTKTFHVPLVGDFNLRLYDIQVAAFNVSVDDAKLVILDGFFNLAVSEVGCQLTFKWHWEKPGLAIEGTGDGELLLHNGNINYVFDVVTDAESSRPRIDVKLANSFFESTELKIHSYSADWLYQAVLSLFNDRISSGINKGIAGALSDDVPDAINGVLSSLPTHINVTGLPFNTAFDYSIYTLSYVLLKGYGEVEVASGRGAGGDDRGSSAMTRCPFQAADLPVGTDAIALEPEMLTIYLHESLLNCMAWGTFHGGTLKYRIVDGTIPNLHLITDLMAMLIPELPKAYPKQQLRIDVEALSAPQLSFGAATGVKLIASYRTTIFVNNETLGLPLVAQLDANLTVTGQLSWDSTTITSAVVKHSLVQSPMTVPTQQWDNTVAWFIQNYAGLYPLQTLVNTFVHTPVTSLVALVNAQGATLDGWFALSGDVQLQDAASLLKPQWTPQ